jgi:hypothetical protein
MNQPNRNKRKFTYFEHKEVIATLQQMAKEETEGPGHIVTVPELIRRSTLKLANKYLTRHGKKQIDYDPSAGKFAPGNPLPDKVVVNEKGDVTLYCKGHKLPWSITLQDIERVLRRCPKCRVKSKIGEQEFHGIAPLLLYWQRRNDDK